MKRYNFLILLFMLSQTLLSQQIINEKFFADDKYNSVFNTNYSYINAIRFDSTSFLFLINKNGTNNLTKYSNSLVPEWSTDFKNLDSNYYDDYKYGSIKLDSNSITCFNPTELFSFSYSYGLKRSIVDLNGNLIESKVMNSKVDTIIGFGYDICNLDTKVLACNSVEWERTIIEFNEEGKIIKKINADSILNFKLLSLSPILYDNEDIYLSGFIADSNQPDKYKFLVSKYDTNYTPIWVQTYNGSVPDKFSFNKNILLKNNTTVYSITVYNSETKRAECLLLFYDHLGNLILQKSFGFASYTYIYKVLLNNDGSYIAFGSTGEKGDLAQNNLVFKMDNNGIVLWSKIWTPEPNFMSYISDAMTIDSNTFNIFGRVSEKYKSKVYMATLKDTSSVASVHESVLNQLSVKSDAQNNNLKLLFQNEHSEFVSIEIFDLNGNSILKTNCRDSFADFDTSGFASGVYLVVIDIEGRKISASCLIE